MNSRAASISIESIMLVLAVPVLMLGALRGALVYGLGLPPQAIYQLSSLLFLVSGLLASWYVFESKNVLGEYLLTFSIKANLLFSVYLFLVALVMQNAIEISTLYRGVAFPLIFSLALLGRTTLFRTIVIISAGTLVGVLYFAQLAANVGWQALVEAQQILRPDEESVSMIGLNLLSMGFQGSHHDAANILVVGGTYFLTICLFSRTESAPIRAASVVLFFASMATIMLTGSAANIAIFLFFTAVSTVIGLFYRKKIAVTIVLVAIIATLQFADVSTLFFFLDKFRNHSNLSSGGMFNGLDMLSISRSIPAILFGLGYVIDVPMLVTEVAFFKILISTGIIPFILFLVIMFYPLLVLMKFRAFASFGSSQISNRLLSKHWQQLLSSAIPLLAGSLTLLHYGSLLRITSIGLFVLVYAVFIKDLRSVSQALRQ